MNSLSRLFLENRGLSMGMYVSSLRDFEVFGAGNLSFVSITAKETARNVEVHSLLGSLTPNYHSIADFRKTNPIALKSNFMLFVLFLKEADLIAGEVIAMDGSKVRANNSKKNNFSPKKTERHLAYIEEKTNEYLAELDKNDIGEQPDRTAFGCKLLFLIIC